MAAWGGTVIISTSRVQVRFPTPKKGPVLVFSFRRPKAEALMEQLGALGVPFSIRVRREQSGRLRTYVRVAGWAACSKILPHLEPGRIRTWLEATLSAKLET